MTNEKTENTTPQSNTRISRAQDTREKMHAEGPGSHHQL
jgi:hypothetical protein